MTDGVENPINMRSLSAETELIAGRYRLVRYLAEGNFGAVYLACQQAYGRELRQVAIKIAKQPMSESQARQTFGDALVMARVQEAAPPDLRDRFVTVHDAGICYEGPLKEGHPYVAMEFVEGGSLSTTLKYGGLPLKRAVAIFDAILEAMACMHEQLYVHRDLKPSNILVCRHPHREDVLKVTDFGLVQQADSLLGWVESGGDLAHLAPECFTRNISSPKTDVYMLGLIFYEMLTGKNPFMSVGTHFKGGELKKDPAKAEELKALHVQARYMERFAFINNNQGEIGQHAALVDVIRRTLEPSLEARLYNNAVELKFAWDKATKGGLAPRQEFPWEKVRRLVDQAECSGVPGAGNDLLKEAMEVNQNKRLVPDHKVVGRAYLLQVKTLLGEEKLAEAGRLATEGVTRRKSFSTLTASALYFEKAGNNAVAAARRREASTCKDTD